MLDDGTRGMQSRPTEGRSQCAATDSCVLQSRSLGSSFELGAQASSNAAASKTAGITGKERRAFGVGGRATGGKALAPAPRSRYLPAFRSADQVLSPQARVMVRPFPSPFRVIVNGSTGGFAVPALMVARATSLSAMPGIFFAGLAAYPSRWGHGFLREACGGETPKILPRASSSIPRSEFRMRAQSPVAGA